MKKVLIKIREFFWPLLEKAPIESNSQTIVEEDIELKISDENLEEAFKLKSKIFENEEERRKSIESKAALFISTISLASSIVVAANALITGNQEYNLPVRVSVLISFILSLYAVRTVWFSIKALERGAYSVLDFEDINTAGTKLQYYSHLIREIQKKVNKNQAKINEKVDHFTMAQEYYKRAIIMICIYSFLIVLFCFFFKKKVNTQPSIQIDKIELFNQKCCDTLKNIIANSIRHDSSHKDTFSLRLDSFGSSTKK